MHGRSALGAFVMTTCLLASACTSPGESAAPTVEPSAATESPSPSPTRPAKTPSPKPTKSPEPRIPHSFDPKNFRKELTDINPWVPLTPGIQTVTKGYVTVGDRRLPHVRVNTVTDVTRTIAGVRAVLVLDQDFDGGVLSEQAIDYLAEDEGGNVWYLGSYTEVYSGGQFLNAEDAWLSGVNGAEVGLYLRADPRPSDPPFTQTSIPGGEMSTAEVSQVHQRTCVPFKCFTDVVVVVEQGAENKYWAPGVGQILTEPLSGSAQETEELINVKELSAKALAELAKEALRLDRGAAVHAPSVFGGSKPATRSR
jgi:hypothetical protein